MADWTPPASDLLDEDIRMGEGLVLGAPGKVSAETQAIRDQKAALLRATYDSNPAYESADLAKIEQVVASKVGRAPKKWTPPQSDSIAWTPPQSDSIAWTPPEQDTAVQTAPKEGPGLAEIALNVPIAQFGNKSINDVKEMIFGQNALPVLLGKMAGYVSRKAEVIGQLRAPDKDGVSAIEREAARRKNAGEDASPQAMEEWVDKESERILYPLKSEPVSAKQYAIDMAKQAIQNPVQTVKGFVEYAITHQEVLAAGPVGGLAIMIGEELLAQKLDEGKIDWNKAGVNLAVNAVPIAAIHAGARALNLRAAKAKEVTPTLDAEQKIVSAVDDVVRKAPEIAALLRAAKAKEVTPTLDAEQKIVSAVDDAIRKAPEIAALLRAPKAKGVTPTLDVEQRAPEIAALLRAPKAKGVTPTLDVEQKIVSSVDDAVRRAPEIAALLRAPKATGVTPTLDVEQKIVAENMAIAALRHISDLMEVPKEEGAAIVDAVKGALEQEKVKVAEPTAETGAEAPVQGTLPLSQAGRIDPKALAFLGLTGVGAATGYALGDDQPEKIRNAIIGAGLPAGFLLARRVKGAADRVFDSLKDVRYRITPLTDQYTGNLRVGEAYSYRLRTALDAILPDEASRTEVLHAVQSGDTSGLSQPQMKYATLLQEAFAKAGERGQAAGILPDELLENYITQLWVRGLNTKDSLLENLMRASEIQTPVSPGMSPKTRFAKMRVLPSYKAGIDAGFVPTTLDPSAILEIYLNNINRAIQNKKFLNALSAEKNAIGQPILARHVDLESEIKPEIKRLVLSKMEISGIDPAAQKMVADIMAIKAPKDYVWINHPQLRNVKVHPDVAAPLRHLFDAADANAATRAAYAVSIAAKRGLFSFALFHAMSLLHAMIGTRLSGWKHVPSALDMLKTGVSKPLNELIYAGLNVVRKPLEADASAFNQALRVLEAKNSVAAVPARGIRWVQEHFDHFLWNVVHPSFKIAAALAEYEKQLTKYPKVPKEQIAKNVVSYVNDVFGGLDWFTIADGVQTKYGRDLALALTSPSGRRFMQIAQLAPDWTVSTTRAMVKAIPGVSTKEIGAMHRGYVMRSAMVYLTIAEGLNLAFSGHHIWDNEDPTMVDLGDGRKMQLSKHFMEPVHWLTKPSQQAWNKLGYVPKEGLLQLLKKDYLSLKGKDVGGPPMDTSVSGRVGHAVRQMLPIPVTTLSNRGWETALTGMIGLPVYGKTEQQAIDDAVMRALQLGPQREEEAAKRAKAQGKDEEKARERTRKYNTPEAVTKRVQKQYETRRKEQSVREGH